MNQPLNLAIGHHHQLTSDVQLKVEQGTLILSRYFASQTPLFYAIHQGFFWWSNNYIELQTQLSSAEVPMQINRGYIRDQIAYQAPLTSETLFSPIRFLRAGETHLLNSQNGQLQQIHFNPGEHGETITKEQFRDILQDQLADFDKNSTVFHISSGLDSSLLALLSAQIHGKGINIASCQTRGSGSNEELNTVKRLSQDIDAQLSIYDLTDMNVFNAGEALIDCIGYPLAHPSHLLEYSLDKAIVNQGATTIVNGKGPDDCLGGYATHMPEFSDSSVHRQRLTVTKQPTLNQLFGDLHGAASDFWQNNKSHISLQQRQYYDARALTDSWNHIHNSVAVGLNCKIVSPFMHPKLRNGLFALPDELRIKGQRQKVFMRDTFADVYPEYLLNLPKSAFRLDLRPYFQDYDQVTLQQRLFDDFSVLEQIIQPQAAIEMITQTLSGERNYGWQLWSLYMACTAIKRCAVYNKQLTVA